MNEAKWYRIDVATSHCAADLVTQLLITLGCRGSVVQPDGEWAVVSGYLPFDGDAQKWSSEIRQRLDAAIAYGLMRKDTRATIEEIDDENWAENWKEHFQPIDVGKRFRILPPWMIASKSCPPLPRAGEGLGVRGEHIIISIEPGMAFGTGQHATTILCLELLESVVREEDVVIDVGTGSGILAIAAAKLGARRVIAVDSDPLCPPAAVKNARSNGVEGRVRILNADLITCLRRRADVIVANLTSFGVITLCEPATALLSAGGAFVASGIPNDRAVEVCQAIQGAGLRIERIREREGWVGIAARFCAE